MKFKIIIVVITLIATVSISRISCVPVTNNYDSSSARLTGQTLIEMGNKLNKPLLRLIGKTMKNLENEMKEVLSNISDIRSQRKEDLVEEMCRLHPCSDWTDWSQCDANTLGQFGGQNRSRNCGVNTTLCERYATSSVEYDMRVCESACPDDYVVTKHGFCLKVYSVKKQRDDAETVCQNDGGHLINVDSLMKVQDVNEIILHHSMTDNLWIDGRRYVQGGTWEYGYKPEDPSFTFWGDDDPDDGASDLCMRYGTFGTGVWSWWDASCNTAHNFMCQIIVDN